MKTIKQFALTLLGAMVVVIGAEVAIVAAVGKEGLRGLPLVGSLFEVTEAAGPAAEPADERLVEIDNILARLKAKEAQQAQQDDQLEQLRALKADLEAVERRNRDVFDRIKQLYPIIDQARQETLKVLAKKYEKTVPQTVAQIFEGMSDQECAELLLVMSDRSVAKVLEAFAALGDSVIEQERNRKRATKINELMRNTLLLSDEKAALFTAP
jgi:flagellar motility protein MotE (MotC chaperone)